MNHFQIRFREVAPKLVQLLTEWTETFPYDFRDERMMRCLKDMTHHVARGDEVSVKAFANSVKCSGLFKGYMIRPEVQSCEN